MPMPLATELSQRFSTCRFGVEPVALQISGAGFDVERELVIDFARQRPVAKWVSEEAAKSRRDHPGTFALTAAWIAAEYRCHVLSSWASLACPSSVSS